MTPGDHDGFGHYEFMTTDDVLGYLRINARTVYRLIKNGEIPAVRIGRQWRVRRCDLDSWLDSQRPGAGK
jgi:excisionase family DNA binding protein